MIGPRLATAALGLALAFAHGASAQDRSFEALAACQPIDVADAVACVASHAPDDAIMVLRLDPEVGTLALDHILRRAWRLAEATPVGDAFRADGVEQPGDMTRLVLRAYLYQSSGCDADWNDLPSWRHATPAGCTPIG